MLRSNCHPEVDPDGTSTDFTYGDTGVRIFVQGDHGGWNTVERSVGTRGEKRGGVCWVRFWGGDFGMGCWISQMLSCFHEICCALKNSIRFFLGVFRFFRVYLSLVQRFGWSCFKTIWILGKSFCKDDVVFGGKDVSIKLLRTTQPTLPYKNVDLPEFFQFMHELVVTLPETNIAPENRPSQKETSIPTIHFQVPC